jgi:inhibitor of KinA sporulation pathway (predicted exonuclease)
MKPACRGCLVHTSDNVDRHKRVLEKFIVAQKDSLSGRSRNAAIAVMAQLKSRPFKQRLFQHPDKAGLFRVSEVQVSPLFGDVHVDDSLW